MTDKKNHSFTIGAFIVGAIVLVFVALLFFSGGRLFSKKDRIIMYFEGSVQGLQIGAPVKLKGVVLGEITDIQIIFKNDNKTVVTAVTADLVMKRINSKGGIGNDEFFTEAIKNGLRAQLNFQSFLTGLLYVELDFYPDTPPRLYQLQRNYREIPTVATQFEMLSKNFADMDIKGMVTHIDQVAIELNKIVSSGDIQKFLISAKNATDSLQATSTNVNMQISVLSQHLNNTGSELDKLLQQLNMQTPVLVQTFNDGMKDLHNSLEQLNKTTVTVNDTFSEDSPLINNLTTTLENVSKSAQAFRNLSDTIEQQPESLLRGKNNGSDFDANFNSKEK